MPRGRGRPRIVRPRLSRLDAAVDAMLPLGFTEERVKKHVKELLEVYGGDESWPFIEEFSYKVLLESLLEKKDDQEEVVQNENLLEDTSCGNEEAGCSLSRASDTEKDMVPPEIVEPSAAVAVTTTTPLSVPSPSVVVETTTTPLSAPSPSPSPSGIRRTRVPCYGWIESDDVDDEFIDLKPAVEPMVVQVRATLDVTTWTKKRRTRWDVKPGDW